MDSFAYLGIRKSQYSGLKVTSGLDLSIMLVSTGIIPAPPAFGGAIESHAFVLSNALARKGARVHFVSDVIPGAKFHPNVRVHPVHSPIKIFPAPFPTWILTHSVGGALSAMTGYSVTLSHRPDVAHFHEETSAAMYLSLKPRVPTAFTLHNPPPWIGQIPSSAEAYVRRTLSLLTAQRVIKRVNKFILFHRSSLESSVPGSESNKRPTLSLTPSIRTSFYPTWSGHEERGRLTTSERDHMLFSSGGLIHAKESQFYFALLKDFIRILQQLSQEAESRGAH